MSAGVPAAKPPFVLVHGAWHGGWCWAQVAQRLQRAGHRVFAPSLTGLADRAHLFGAQVTLATHVDDICRLIDWEGLENCVLVGHSYGGNVISGVANRFRERVSHYVFLDAVVPPDDATRWRWADFNDADAQRARRAVIASQGAGVALPPPPPEVFGVTDPAQQQWLRERMTPMPVGTFESEIRLENGASRGLRRTYIAVTQPPFASMAPIYRRLRGDASWNYLEIATGHDAMVLAPDLLCELLLPLAA